MSLFRKKSRKLKLTIIDIKSNDGRVITKTRTKGANNFTLEEVSTVFNSSKNAFVSDTKEAEIKTPPVSNLTIVE